MNILGIAAFGAGATFITGVLVALAVLLLVKGYWKLMRWWTNTRD